MSQPDLSIIIPTCNRSHILVKTLDAYCKQADSSQVCEVIVIDDGSRDDTRGLVNDLASSSPVPLRYFYQGNSGLAAARNHGIREAKGNILLFADDDIIPGPKLVAEHLKWHSIHPEPELGVLGYVTWSPEVRATPLMRWMGNDGPLFSFAGFSPGQDVGFEFSYFCNTSVKIDFLLENGVFDETFKSYGYEDIELGYRLYKRGMRLIYIPDALGYHYKFMSFNDLCQRARVVAVAEKFFLTKEAGSYLARISMPEARSKTRLIRKQLGSLLNAFLPVLRPFADSRVPLPWVLYRRLYSRYGVAPAKLFAEAAGTEAAQQGWWPE